MSSIGSNGIYRLYRVYPQGHEHVQQRLVGVFAIVGGSIHHMEDHDGLLEDMVPEGKLNDRLFYRLLQVEESPYWRLVHENDVQDGEHPDLLQEAQSGGEPWPAPVPPSPSVKVEGEPASDES